MHKTDGKLVRNNISFCHLNVRSILATSDIGFSRKDLLYNFCCTENSYDVILLSETHLDETIMSSEIDFEGFELFRNDRDRDGGGVCIYARNELSPIHLKQFDSPEIESIYIQVLNSDFPCIFGVCYRPPNQSADLKNVFLEAIRVQLDILCLNNNKLLVMCGDYNDRCTNWYSDHSESELGLLFFDLTCEYDLTQLIDKPTRGENILDLIIVNRPDLIIGSGVCESFDNLDHSVIFGVVKVHFSKQLNYIRMIRHYTDERLQTLNTALGLVPWHTVLSNTLTVDECVHTFNILLLDEIDSIIPQRSVKIKPRDKVGMTSEIRKLFNRTHALHRLAKKTKNIVDIENHRNARRLAKKAWYSAQKEYYKKLYAKSNSNSGRAKTFWKIIKSNFGNKNNTRIPTLRENNTDVTCDADKAILFNNFFSDQSTLDLSKEPKLPTLSTKTDKTILNISVLSEQVLSILNSLDTSKATGPDGVGNNVLRSCAESLCYPITFVAQMSLDQGVFPAVWKRANVVPVYKKGDKHNKKNYRPVSLLSNISKVVEKIIYMHLYDYCMLNKILSPKNSGFKKGDGAINQLLGITNNLYKSLDDGMEVAMVFLDISRAFDRVWHKGLIFKLKGIGVSGSLLSWLVDYISGRSQKVVVAGQESPLQLLNAGVPQGSILGPLLFLIFIDDIVENLSSDIFLFADDTTLAKAYTSSIEAEFLLNNDLENVNIWAKQWLVAFNPDKTVFMNFSFKKRKSIPRLCFNGVFLRR